MLRLFTRDIEVTRRSRLLCYATIAITVLWAIGSLIATTMACSPSNYVKGVSDGRCNNRLNYWKAMTALNILTEILLFALPILFVWPIQMKRYIKVQVAIAFGFRLPLIGITAVHLNYISAYSNATNISQAIISALVVQQCELLWSLLSATIPTLKAFMRTFNSGFGMEIDLDSPYANHSGAQDSRTYILGSAQHSSRSGTARIPGVTTAGPRKDTNPAELHVSNKKATGLSESRTRSQSSFTGQSSRELIIEREVAWRVSHEETMDNARR